MDWQVVGRPELIARSGADPYAVAESGPGSFGLVSEAGWALLEPAGPDRAGATVVFDEQPPEQEIRATLVELDAVAAARGWRLAWVTSDAAIDVPSEPRWTRESRWVWMSATRMLAAVPERWRLVELDDTADAEEINAFALPINPLFEGDPGLGHNRLWLGARDDAGRLIGCGTAHDLASGVGHLAGLVVDPSYRRRGLGRALVIGLSSALIDADGIATLSAYADNEPAIRLYREVGYRLDHSFRSRSSEPRRGDPFCTGVVASGCA